MTRFMQDGRAQARNLPFAARAPHGRLAVLDDESIFCDFVEYVGDLSGYEVFATIHPHLLLDYLEDHPEALVVLDLHMPNVDGLDMLRHLARLGVTDNVLLASGADSRVLETATRLGRAHGLSITGVIRKPIDMGGLQAVLGNQSAGGDVLNPARLEAALQRGELALHYQPMVDLRSGAIDGVEALMRWRHPQRGLVMPGAFIAMAERSDLIVPLTDWALGEAVKQAARWRRDDGLALKISVNLSIAGVPDRGLPDRLARLCADAGVAPAAIGLELTESAAMREPAALMEIFTRFRLRGFDLAIDDFGTGYSSLKHLQRLPFSGLKIDKSFVGSMLASDSSAAIVKAVIGLAQTLGLRSVAEGVESAAMLDFLRAQGCDYAQGYHIAKPMPAADIPAFLAA